jgi:hypothetical protein
MPSYHVAVCSEKEPPGAWDIHTARKRCSFWALSQRCQVVEFLSERGPMKEHLTALHDVQANCMYVPQESLLAKEDIADVLVDAGLLDVAIIDMTATVEQRDCDWLIVASGRSGQHAMAGAHLHLGCISCRRFV